MFGMQELVIILIIVVLLFGGKKIPELFSGLGKGIKSFRKSMDEDDDGDSRIEKPGSSDKQDQS